MKTLEGPSEAFEAGEEVFYNEVGKFLFAAQVMLAQTCLRLIVVTSQSSSLTIMKVLARLLAPNLRRFCASAQPLCCFAEQATCVATNFDRPYFASIAKIIRISTSDISFSAASQRKFFEREVYFCLFLQLLHTSNHSGGKSGLKKQAEVKNDICIN